jgi:hypothetical protein
MDETHNTHNVLIGNLEAMETLGGLSIYGIIYR